MREFLRKETCRIIREKIENAYEGLESEKENFYDEKERQLAEIRKDLLEYNISDYEVLQNVKELRQQRVLDRQEKFVPKPNTYKWIPYIKEQKKEMRRERDEHRRSLIERGTTKLKALEGQLWINNLNLVTVMKMYECLNPSLTPSNWILKQPTHLLQFSWQYKSKYS